MIICSFEYFIVFIYLLYKEKFFRDNVCIFRVMVFWGDLRLYEKFINLNFKIVI